MKTYLDLVTRADHPRWPHLTTVLLAKVGESHATKPHRFYAECFVDYCDDARTQSTCMRIFPTEAEAEAHGRLFFATMLPFWQESLRTHAVPVTPFSRYAAAMAAHVAAETRALREAYEAADREARANPNARVLWSVRDDRRHALARAENELELAWLRGRCWSEFIEAPAGQLALFGAA